ncbi:MAG: metallophosphoesterase [Acetatifactor sp.]|nr:metallophosphoesterase [Acetatifactor sp.]
MNLLNIIISIFALIILILLWVIVFDSNRFVVRTYEIRDKKIKKPLRMAVVSDLHNKVYGKDNYLLIDRIKKEQPDVVILAGDILTAVKGKTLDIAVDFTDRISKEFHTYYGFGNHEHRLLLYPERFGNMGAEYMDRIGKTNARILDNSYDTFEDFNIRLYGSKVDRRFYKKFTSIVMRTEDLESVMGAVDEGYYNILLAHHPDYFYAYAGWGADLTISGHVHGGVARIPFIWKGVISPALKFFPKYDGGEFNEYGKKMILSRGLGMHTIPIRLFNPGELVIIDLKPVE